MKGKTITGRISGHKPNIKDQKKKETNMNLYIIQVHFLIIIKGEKREETLSTPIYAANKHQAIDAAVFWANDRLQVDFFEEITCIKVFNYIISTWQPDIPLMTAAMSLSCIFEWKYDWPSSLKQTVNIFKEKMEKVRARKSLGIIDDSKWFSAKKEKN